MPSVKKTGKHQKLPEAVRRAAILEAAHKLFNRNGFEKTRMDDVAAMAGLTKGGLYFHFKDKQSLYEAVMFYCKERMEQIIIDISSQDLAPVEMLQAYMFAMVQEMVGDFEGVAPGGYPGAVEMFMEGHRRKSTQDKLRAFYHRTRSFMAGIIEQGIKEGVFRESVDPRIVSLGAVSMWVGLYLQYASDPAAFDLKEVALNQINSFLDGLRRKTYS